MTRYFKMVPFKKQPPWNDAYLENTLQNQTKQAPEQKDLFIYLLELKK